MTAFRLVRCAALCCSVHAGRRYVPRNPLSPVDSVFARPRCVGLARRKPNVAPPTPESARKPRPGAHMFSVVESSAKGFLEENRESSYIVVLCEEL